MTTVNTANDNFLTCSECERDTPIGTQDPDDVVCDHCNPPLSAHTPGPWKIEGSCVHAPNRKVETMHGKKEAVICEMFMETKMGVQEQKANARVIIAAPNLLEALIECTSAIGAAENVTDNPKIKRSMNRSYRIGMEAIAKAKGE